MPNRNIDEATVTGFGEEWAEYDQTQLSADDLEDMFEDYFRIFPFSELPANAEGFDLGCGSGRWADLVLQRVCLLHCIDPSEQALAVASRRLSGRRGAIFHKASVDDMPIAAQSQDFGYSLGVLHHVPDPQAAIERCVEKLKIGAPFLVYLYYRFDNRPAWYARLWKLSDTARKFISKMPFEARKTASRAIAASIYWPLARGAGLAERLGFDVRHFPLNYYRRWSFYTMRTDALDRFGTRVEHRFSRVEIEKMLRDAGLEAIKFSDGPPYWIACGRRAR